VQHTLHQACHALNVLITCIGPRQSNSHECKLLTGNLPKTKTKTSHWHMLGMINMQHDVASLLSNAV
jgi:hypothetical protein